MVGVPGSREAVERPTKGHVWRYTHQGKGHTHTLGRRVYPKGGELWHFESGQSALCNSVAPAGELN